MENGNFGRVMSRRNMFDSHVGFCKVQWNDQSVVKLDDGIRSIVQNL